MKDFLLAALTSHHWTWPPCCLSNHLCCIFWERNSGPFYQTQPVPSPHSSSDLLLQLISGLDLPAFSYLIWGTSIYWKRDSLVSPFQTQPVLPPMSLPKLIILPIISARFPAVSCPISSTCAKKWILCYFLTNATSVASKVFSQAASMSQLRT